MSTQRIVTEEIDGRSRVQSDGLAESQYWLDELWVTIPGVPMGFDPGDELPAENVAPRHSLFQICHLPPDKVVHAALAAGPAGKIVGDGFHRTQTIDYVLVLDGPVELVLDEGSVIMKPGDCVIQRGTNDNHEHLTHRHR